MITQWTQRLTNWWPMRGQTHRHSDLPPLVRPHLGQLAQRAERELPSWTSGRQGN